MPRDHTSGAAGQTTRGQTALHCPRGPQRLCTTQEPPRAETQNLRGGPGTAEESPCPVQCLE